MPEDPNIIGKACGHCDRIITAADDEAHQYYHERYDEQNDETIKLPVAGVYCCCDACHDELEDGDRAAMADDIERGADYPD